MAELPAPPDPGTRVLVTVRDSDDDASNHSGTEFRLAGTTVDVDDASRVRLRLAHDVDRDALDTGLHVIAEYSRDGVAWLLHADVEELEWLGGTEALPGPAVLRLSPAMTIERRERRRHFRLPILTSARLWVRNPPASFDYDAKVREACLEAWQELDPEDAAPATTVDLGAGGVRLSTDAELTVGTLVMAEISLPGRTLRLPARVTVGYPPAHCHSEVPEYGLAFVGTGADDEDFLLGFVFTRGRRVRTRRPR